METTCKSNTNRLTQLQFAATPPPFEPIFAIYAAGETFQVFDLVLVRMPKRSLVHYIVIVIVNS